MSIHLYNPDIDGKLKIESKPKINNTPTKTITATNKPTITLFNPYTKPVVDNRPQYLKDRDIREAKGSVDFNKVETKRIMKTIQDRDNQERFYKNPMGYETGKLEGELSSIVSKI